MSIVILLIQPYLSHYQILNYLDRISVKVILTEQDALEEEQLNSSCVKLRNSEILEHLDSRLDHLSQPEREQLKALR